jgi:hypothetical protein
MNTKKSKFQERLDQAVKKHTRPEEDPGGINDQVNLHKTNLFSGVLQVTTRKASQTAHPPNPGGFQNWISVEDLLPDPYRIINIWDGNDVLYNWYRVKEKDGENVFYVNNENEGFRTDVTHWSYPYVGNIPNTVKTPAKDLPGYDLKEIIKAMEKRKRFYSTKFIDPTEFIEAIDDCIQIVKRKLKKVTKDSKLNLHKK